MTPRIVILRPEPGASASAKRACALGLDPIVAPLFDLHPLAWDPPDPARFDAVLLTSANAARLAGPGLAGFAHLPCHAVGEASAAATAGAGFLHIETGPGDAGDALAAVAAAGHARVFHPCGRDHVAVEAPGVTVTRRAVYAAEARDALDPEAARAIADGVLVLVHSPRAGALLGALVADRGTARIAAISAAAAEAAGQGWAEVHVAASPRDEALLELAARLCDIRAEAERGR